MKGRRLPDDASEWSEGDYGRNRGVWHCRPPRCHLGSLERHDVTEHEDGTITVSPSILLHSTDADGKTVELWHGFLERGVWREC